VCVCVCVSDDKIYMSLGTIIELLVSFITTTTGARGGVSGGVVVETLRYKPEGRGFDS
jgi:hypothetical protein